LRDANAETGSLCRTRLPAVMLSQAKHLNSVAAANILRFAEDGRSGHVGDGIAFETAAR